MSRNVPRAARAVSRAPRRIRRHHKGGIGTAISADCPGPAPVMIPNPQPCNEVLIGPPATPGPGSGIAGGGDAGAAPDAGNTGDPNSGDATVQTCQDGSELSTYIRCRGLTPAACEDACANIGAYCVAGAYHPYGSMAGGVGGLKQCQENALNYTCTYCFPNGDVCTRTKLAGLPPFWLCSYTGGKGCD